MTFIRCRYDPTEWRSLKRVNSRLPGMVAALLFAVSPVVGGNSSLDSGVIMLQPVGCNATSLAQVPGYSELFLGRQLLTAAGQIAGPNDCSGGNPDNQKIGKIFNRWALTLSKLDWSTHKFTLLKVLLDTSIDPVTKLSRAVVTGGPMKGAVIRSAYDPDVVHFHDDHFIVYECTLENGKPFAVQGTSSCISAYDPGLQKIDLGRTLVIVSGAQIAADSFSAAAVPELLVYRNRLFLYWSALSIEKDRFTQVSIRGAELLVTKEGVSVKGAGDAVVRSLDEPATTRVWAVDPADPLSSTTADLRALWVAKDSIVVAASLGGSGCTAPSGAVPGCYRLALAKTEEPLANNGFGRGHRINARLLPSNAQEYTRPIRDPAGAYWFIGHYIRPGADGVSDVNPMPNATFWKQYETGSALVMFPFVDGSLWPMDW
jgi:hypothetical protein